MAWDSDGTDGRRLYNGAFAPLNNSIGPFTIAFWFRSDSTTQTNKYLMLCKDLTAADEQWAVIYEYVNNTVEFFSVGYTGLTDPRTNSGMTVADTIWHHLAYRKGALNGGGTTTWDKFLDGTKTSIDAAADFRLPATLAAFMALTAAAGATPTFSASPNGKIGPLGIWDVALADSHIAALARRVPIHRVYSASRVAHYEMGGRSPEPNLVGSGGGLTNTGCTAADHAPTAPPFAMLGGWHGAFTAAAAAGGKPWLHYARQRAA